MVWLIVRIGFIWWNRNRGNMCVWFQPRCQMQKNWIRMRRRVTPRLIQIQSVWHSYNIFTNFERHWSTLNIEAKEKFSRHQFILRASINAHCTLCRISLSSRLVIVNGELGVKNLKKYWSHTAHTRMSILFWMSVYSRDRLNIHEKLLKDWKTHLFTYKDSLSCVTLYSL